MTNELKKAIEIVKSYLDMDSDVDSEYLNAQRTIIQALESQRWIPVSERLPENLQTVNVTWQNHEPEPYYHDIKDRSFVATAVYYNEDWYWYSTTCADYLGEYGRNDVDKIDEAIEIIAWMPLPTPYRAESEDAE